MGQGHHQRPRSRPRGPRPSPGSSRSRPAPCPVPTRARGSRPPAAPLPMLPPPVSHVPPDGRGRPSWPCASACAARRAGASGEGALDAAREVLDERRLCVNASGTHSLYDFGEKTLADNVTKLTFAEDCAGFSCVSLDMLCYGMTSLVSVTGLGFFVRAREHR